MNNWKEKIIVGIALLLVFLFVAETTAQASAQDYVPDYGVHLLKDSTATANNQVYHFYITADGITCDADGNVVAYGGTSNIVNFEFKTITTTLPLADYTGMYDYFNLEVQPYFNSDLTYTDFGNGLGSITQGIVSTTPYLIINGDKHYLVNGRISTIEIDNIIHSESIAFGVEVCLNINYNASSVGSSPNTYYGYSTYACEDIELYIALYGVRYSSTGEEAIVDSVVSWGSILNTGLNNLKNSINTQSNYVAQKIIDVWNKLVEVKDAITVTLVNKLTDVASVITKNDDENTQSTLTKMQAFMTMAQNNHDALFELLEFNHSDDVMWFGDIWNEIMWGFEDMRTWMKSHSQWLTSTYTEFKNDFQKKHETIVAKLDEIIETLTRGYENPVGDSVDSKMDSDLIDLDIAQKNVTDGATENLNNFTVPSDGFNSFDPRFMGAFALVSGMLQTIFDTSGNFTITMSVIFIMTIASMVTGLFRYFKE